MVLPRPLWRRADEIRAPLALTIGDQIPVGTPAYDEGVSLGHQSRQHFLPEFIPVHHPHSMTLGVPKDPTHRSQGLVVFDKYYADVQLRAGR